MTENNNTIYGYQKQKFKGFGEYNNDLLKENEGLINSLIELTKNEYPNMDNYFIWLCAVDYVMEELGIKKENLGKEQYENYLKEKDKLIYDSVILKDDTELQVK